MKLFDLDHVRLEHVVKELNALIPDHLRNDEMFPGALIVLLARAALGPGGMTRAELASSVAKCLGVDDDEPLS